jgi:hypothetical protein
MACPFFYPVERSYAIGWAFPARLPLGVGYCGTCRAGGAEVTPTDIELRDYCNLGYAKGCQKMPEVRFADCVRFALSKDDGTRIALQYVYERGHEPVKNGVVEYDCLAHQWTVSLSDAIVQRQAECFLATYLERRPRPLLDTKPPTDSES